MTPATDTRTAIMDAFREQLGNVGYQGISLSAVARAAGIQKPSLYHHFPAGKEQIYTAVATAFISALHNDINAALESSSDFAEQLEALVVPVSAHGQSGISFEQRIYDTLAHVSPDTSTEISELYVSQVLSPVKESFTQAVEKGLVVGDPWFLTNAFLHLSRAADMISDESAAQQLVRLFLHGAQAGIA